MQAAYDIAEGDARFGLGEAEGAAAAWVAEGAGDHYWSDRGGRDRAYYMLCYDALMGTLNVRTDEAMETALRALTEGHRTRSEAVRYAVLRTYKEMLLEQAKVDAERLAADPDDQAEMLAIQRFMGVAE